jgi:hypothetical protein
MSDQFDHIKRYYNLPLSKGDPVYRQSNGRKGKIHDVDGAYLIIHWEGDELPSGPYHPFDDLRFPKEDERNGRLVADRLSELNQPQQKTAPEPIALTEEEIEKQSALWQEKTGLDREARAHFEAGLRWAIDNRLLSPYPFKPHENYSAVLINALRLGQEGMSKLMTELIDRGAYLEQGKDRFINEERVKDILRDIIWHGRDGVEAMEQRGVRGGL